MVLADLDDLASERVLADSRGTRSGEFATSPDGTQVPITVISPRGLPRDGTAPVLLAGYGGYGFTLRPRFDPGKPNTGPSMTPGSWAAGKERVTKCHLAEGG